MTVTLVELLPSSDSAAKSSRPVRPNRRRAWAIGLSLAAYLTSKVVVLTALTAVQATLFTALSLFGRSPPDDPLVLPDGHLEILVAVLGVAVVSMLAGLALSAFIGNGGLFTVHGRPVLEHLAWFAPARWGLAMAAASGDLRTLPPVSDDPLWEPCAAVWAAEGVVL